MLSIQNSTLRMTRGDSAAIDVAIMREDSDGTRTDYACAADDVILFTARRACGGAPQIEKRLAGETRIMLSPADTAHLSVGEYVYDVELRTAAGEVYTVAAGRLWLEGEVSVWRA